MEPCWVQKLFQEDRKRIGWLGGGSGGGNGSEREGAEGGEIEITHLGEGKMALGGSLLATKTVGCQLPKYKTSGQQATNLQN